MNCTARSEILRPVQVRLKQRRDFHAAVWASAGLKEVTLFGKFFKVFSGDNLYLERGVCMIAPSSPRGKVGALGGKSL
jgi:hypothetical protein